MFTLKVPRTKRGLALYFFAVGITTFTIFSVSNSSSIQKTALSPSPENNVLGTKDEKYLVTKIIDDYTFSIDTGETVRLIGVDSESIIDANTKSECFKKESTKYLNELLVNKQVNLERDILDKDSSGRLLRYVYVDNLFVNNSLLKKGLAQVFVFPPNVKYQKLFNDSQKEAFFGKAGIWGEKCSI